MSATLFAFGGLPGSGKSTLAQRLAAGRRAVWLRIDTIEQGLRDHCALDVEGEGYALAMRIAADNLRLGIDVVADSCNPIGLTRRAWAEVAEGAGARLCNIEVVCSDPDEHRRRVEGRANEVPGLRQPTWADVQGREYDPWGTGDGRLLVDTAGRSVDAALVDLLRLLEDGAVDAQPDD